MNIQRTLDDLKDRIVKNPPSDPVAFHSISRTLYRLIDEELKDTSLRDVVRPKLEPINALLSGIIDEKQKTIGLIALSQVISDIENYITQINSPAFGDAIARAVSNIIKDTQAEKDALTFALNKAEKDRTSAGKALEDVKKELDKLKTVSDRLESETKKFDDIIQQREVVKNQGDFRTQAKYNIIISIILFASIIATIGAFILYLLPLLNNETELFNLACSIHDQSLNWDKEFSNKITYIEIARKISIRIFIYSLAVYFISFLIKNFTSQMHNYTANSNKANALDSMISLIPTIETPEGKDAILIHVTQAIFTSQHTGYQNKEDEPNSPSVVNNIIDAIQPKSK